MVFPVPVFHLPVPWSTFSSFDKLRITCSHTKHKRHKERYLTTHPGTQMEAPMILIITFQLWPPYPIIWNSVFKTFKTILVICFPFHIWVYSSTKPLRLSEA